MVMIIGRGTMTMWVLVLVVGVTMVQGFQENLRLVGRGYEGLTVEIMDHAEDRHCNEILYGLKNTLTEFSKELHKITQGRASLRDVTVSLPKSWKTGTDTCTLWAPLITSSAPVNSHIRLKETHPVFGDQPWVQQSQGCGRPGDFIQMGTELMKSTNNASYVHNAQNLMAQWVKYRWGVFDDHGYEGDALYPSGFRDPKTGNPRQNYCENKGGAPFCSKEEHISQAPTKQNSQCHGRAVWDIIMESTDFKNNRDLSINPDAAAFIPAINFVQPGIPRVIIAVENTEVMNLQDRWDFIRKAVRRVVVYDIPEEVEIGLVVFNSRATTTAPLTKIDDISDVRYRIGSSMPRNPSGVPESHKCLVCGLREAVMTLESAKASGGTVILITTGSSRVSQDEVDEMIRFTTVKNIRLDIIFYPVKDIQGYGINNNGLQRVSSVTNGVIYTVMDESVGQASKVNMMMSLMDSLLAAVRQSVPGTPSLVHTHTYPGGYTTMASGTFSIDESLSQDARFAVYYNDLDHVGNTIQLKTPSGRIMSSINMQEEDGDANVIFVNIPSAERGEWHYEVENRADSHHGLHIQVTSAKSEKRDTSLHVWTTAINNIVNVTDVQHPVIVYAELTDDGLPVLKAKVIATLQRLGTNATGSLYEPIEFQLYDYGFGDPDITADDGVYSRYLPVGVPNMEQGQYELTVSADHNDGIAVKPVKNTDNYKYENIGFGSSIYFNQVIFIEPFQRTMDYGVLNILINSNETNILPPTRILDLTAAVNISNYKVSLHWTSPGGDFDWGNANQYEAVIAESWEDAMSFEGSSINNLPKPIFVGNEQTATFIVEKYEKVLYIVMRAVDEANNLGELSNVVGIWVPHPPIDTTLSAKSVPKDSLDNELSNGVISAEVDTIDWAVIIGSIIGFLIVVIIIVVACFLFVARRKRSHNKDKVSLNEKNKNYFIKANSLLVLDDIENQENVKLPKEEVLGKDGNQISSPNSCATSTILNDCDEDTSSSIDKAALAASEEIRYNQTLQENFQPISLAGSSSYPNSQASSRTPSSMNIDPPAYQPTYVSTDPYSYSPTSGYSSEELPPYSPQGISQRSSQASTAYTYELPPQLSDLPHLHEISEYGEGSFNYPQTVHPALLQNTYSTSSTPTTTRSKIPPTVAPKPSKAARNAAVALAVATSLQPIHQNATLV
ncbi:unnamed protein product [Meganyctiphanes norvegica]|uniref:Calcium-activated chloride channel N-terminal domain-containing protein n=1 Tax=Meganyctiphanes norvegica TaxID=48144 RepID=A0AAV2REU3_MEGNR